LGDRPPGQHPLASSLERLAGNEGRATPMSVSTPVAAGTEVAQAKGRHKAPLSEGARAERRLGWLLCAPAVIVMIAVTAYPVGYAIYLSLERYNLELPNAVKFVGFSNYAAVLTSHFWWEAFTVTVIITAVSVSVTLVLGMMLAMLMHRTLFARGSVRTAALVPYGIVTVAAAYGWQYAWTPGQGYLSDWTGTSAPLTHQVSAIAVIILAEIWKTTPFMGLLLLAGLSLVPEDLQRAAKVDGATAWQRFTRITLPLMKPAILVALLFRTLDSFRIFDNIYIMTGGNNLTGSVSILGYDNLFNALNLGIGSAISILIFICVAIIAFLFIKGFGTAAPGTGTGRR
jgi:trehalose/maltose transport system permease protein